ncbi:potassium-transporting ATPase subunit KdpA, partial [Escherichia coli]|uniref:potassium-transporting ATPase subunit KdpA n=1 Tax=Escherichia coli TaxID=562 RepID=UPI003CE555C0
FAVMRGFLRAKANGIGNFWLDLWRVTAYVLLPIAFAGALIMVAMGVIQNVSAPVVVQTLEGVKQSLPLGPVASQEVIKQLG